MPKRTSASGSELFIVDNSDQDWKVLRYLRDWCRYSKSIDVATAYFEIGSLLALDGEWQKADKIRILMGDEVSKRTKKAFEEGLTKIKERLNASLEAEKEKNDFLVGVPAIVEALRTGKIQCRVYRQEKFHAKTYITTARDEVIGSFALVGSSNFTYPGLTENIELNVQITGGPVTVLQEWYEEHWNKAEDVTPEMLRVLERHIREYSPFEVYAKSLQEFFRGHEMTADEWEKAGQEHGSHIYTILDQYQKDGYHAALKIASRYQGAFVCDGVGLGKTYIGLMLIERLIHDRKRVALFVPKAARKVVWEVALKKHLGHLFGGYTPLLVFNHTDLGRENEEIQLNIRSVLERADAIVIDEAHHFRNPGVAGEGERKPSRYRRMLEIGKGKQLYLLTATPVNNRIVDLMHLIELFAPTADHFRDIGIHSLQGHFRKMEKALEAHIQGNAHQDEFTITNEVEAEKVLSNDTLFKAVIVQRSRAYVRKSIAQHGGKEVIFPRREDPKVKEYSLKKTYQRLLDQLEKAFSKKKPLFSLAIYYPLFYAKEADKNDPEFKWREGRQKMVVGLIRTMFLKRFESSARAFELSCKSLLEKLVAFVQKNSHTHTQKTKITKWLERHEEVLGYFESLQGELFDNANPDSDEDDQFEVSEEVLESTEQLDANKYDIDAILDETWNDMDQVMEFLQELSKFKPSNDDKLKALIKLLKTDPILKDHKVLIFSEFMATARYLKKELQKAGIEGVEEVDSSTKGDRAVVICQFSPYYNDSSSSELKKEGLSETRILISTDVLSEGLNLQDATRLINYDLHWNPVRLMQRIGRVDRRLNPDVETKILADHPDQKVVRGTAAYWNFLPPDELNDLLKLYTKVTGKVLAISKTFGIEGKKLLHPEDDFDALKDFNHDYEGQESETEKMLLEYRQLLLDNPDLENLLTALPLRVFSGKKHPTPGTKAVFFCYAMPARDNERSKEVGEEVWTIEAGETKWYLYDLATEKCLEEPTEIAQFIRSTKDTPRHCVQTQSALAAIRASLDKHIRNSHLKKIQAPIGVKPILKCWMELS